MTALQLRVGTWLRRALPSAVALVVVVAALCGMVMALAAGARRTSAAPDRYTSANDPGFDVSGQQDGGRPRTAELAALPGVRSAASMSFVFGGIMRPSTGEFLDALVFAGAFEVAGPRLVAGRPPDPTRAGEFMMTTDFAAASELAIGDQIELITLTPEDAATNGFDTSTATGPRVDGVLVGTFELPPLIDDPTPISVFSPALLDDERVGVSGTVFGLALDDGVSRSELQAQIGTLAEPQQFVIEDFELISSESRTAVRGQTLGLWVLAALAAVATIAVLGQVLARSVRMSADEVLSLRALGYRRRDIVAETTLRAAVLVGAGVLLAVVVAIGVSGAFPIGFVRPVDPDGGLRIEAVVLTGAALVLLAALIAWVAFVNRPVRPVSLQPRVSTLDAVAARCPSSSMAAGVRFAYGPRNGSTTTATTFGAVILFVALVGGLTFAVSSRRLVDDPARYGSNFDALIDDGSAELAPSLVDLAAADPLVAFTLYVASQARVGDTTIAVAAMDPMKGELTPAVLSGRLPRSADEAALGRRSARELDVSMGEEIELRTDTDAVRYRVVGLVVPPGLRGNDVVGHGALITGDGLARLDPGAVPNAMAIAIDKSAPPGYLAAFTEQAGLAGYGRPARPPAIVNIARVTFVPFVLAALIALLAAVIAVNVLFTGVRRRGAHVAVLRALGADRGWLVRTLLWQAVAWFVVPVAIGVPLGLVAGRLAFRALADSTGAVNDAATPMLLTVTTLAALAVLGMITTVVAGRRWYRSHPAPLLRAG